MSFLPQGLLTTRCIYRSANKKVDQEFQEQIFENKSVFSFISVLEIKDL